MMTPLIAPARLQAVDGAFDVPAPHTDEEIACLVRLARQYDARTIAIGHGPGTAPAVAAFAQAWTAAGGEVIHTVAWPDRAASWLRHAKRFVGYDPDLWLMTGAPAGTAQMIRRLSWSTSWRPDRTLGFASLTHPAVAALAGPELLEGLRGATAQGQVWRTVG
jgi:hypothetical protein